MSTTVARQPEGQAREGYWLPFLTITADIYGFRFVRLEAVGNMCWRDKRGPGCAAGIRAVIST